MSQKVSLYSVNSLISRRSFTIHSYLIPKVTFGLAVKRDSSGVPSVPRRMGALRESRVRLVASTSVGLNEKEIACVSIFFTTITLVVGSKPPAAAP